MPKVCNRNASALRNSMQHVHYKTSCGPILIIRWHFVFDAIRICSV